VIRLGYNRMSYRDPLIMGVVRFRGIRMQRMLAGVLVAAGLLAGAGCGSDEAAEAPAANAPAYEGAGGESAAPAVAVADGMAKTVLVAKGMT